MIVEGPKSEETRASELTPKELDEFRGLLLEKRRDLLGDLTGMTAEAKGAGPGEGDEEGARPEQQKFADESDDREITINLLASERALLQEISEALERIEKGTYGVCAAAGEPIGKNRLLARPWAKYCIACARSMERKGKSAGARAARPMDLEHLPVGSDAEVEREARDMKAIAGSDDDE